MYYNLWVASLIVGFLLLALAILFTFIFRVPDLLDELSGRKAKRQIKKLKEINKGTGSLDGEDFRTTDFYKSVSSGFLLSKGVLKEDVKPVDLKAEGVVETTTGNLLKRVSKEVNEDMTDLLNPEQGNSKGVETSRGSEESEVSEAFTTALQEEIKELVSDESATSFIGSQDLTVGAKDPEKEQATSFMDSDEVTSFLTELEEFSSTKHSVSIIEEQSSLTTHKEETE